MENKIINQEIAKIAIDQIAKTSRNMLSPMGVQSLIDHCNARDWCNDYQYSMQMIFSCGITLVRAIDGINWWAISPLIDEKKTRLSALDANPVKAALTVIVKLHQ